ncbi:Transient receptor putative cation channel sub V member 4, partial [Rhizoclosmatium hyalinum]
MFQFLKNVNPNLLNQLNEAKQTPLGVGLSEGNVNVLEAVKDVLWDFDKVCRYRVPLNELDPLFNRDDSEVGKNVLLNLYQSVKKAFSEESEKKHASLIEMAVYHHDKDIICHPVIDTILRYKWKLYAQYFFLGRFVTALVNVLLFFTPAVAMQPNTLADRRHYDLTNSHVDKVRLAFEILTILGSLYTFFVSWHDTFKKYNLITNITRWSFGLLVFFVPLIRLFAVDESVGLNAENVCIGIAAIIGWIHLVRFARGFEAVGPLIEVVTQICFKDFFQWLVIYIPLTVGFGTALFLQMQTAGVRAVEAGNLLAEDWDTNFAAVLSAVRFQFQQEQYSDFKLGGIPGFAIALFMTYGFLATLLLANILISKLVDTFERIHDDANREWKLDLARLILSIDLRLSPDQKTKYLKDFGFEVDDKNAIAHKGNEKVKVLQ